MILKRLGAVTALFIFLAFPAFSSTVSLLLVETGLSAEFLGTQHTMLWEDGLLDAFFDAGHIVTNSPILRMERRPSQDLTGQVKNDWDEAGLGGVDYFVLGFLEYQMRGEAAVPVRIALKIYTTNSQKLLFEQNFPVGRGKDTKEEFQFARDTGRLIISKIKDR